MNENQNKTEKEKKNININVECPFCFDLIKEENIEILKAFNKYKFTKCCKRYLHLECWKKYTLYCIKNGKEQECMYCIKKYKLPDSCFMTDWGKWTKIKDTYYYCVPHQLVNKKFLFLGKYPYEGIINYSNCLVKFKSIFNNDIFAIKLFNKDSFDNGTVAIAAYCTELGPSKDIEYVSNIILTKNDKLINITEPKLNNNNYNYNYNNQYLSESSESSESSEDED